MKSLYSILIAMLLLQTTGFAQKSKLSYKEADAKAMNFFYANKDSAYYYLTKAVKLSYKEPDTIQSKALLKIGVFYSIVVLNDSALYYFDRALPKASESYRANVLCSYGQHYKNRGDYEKSIDYFNQSLTISKNHSDKLVGIVYGELGSVFILKKDHKQGIEYLLKGIAIMKKLNVKSYQAIQEQNLASVYFNDHNYAFAKEIYKSCIPQLKISPNKQNYGIVLGNYGDCLYYLKHYKQSLLALLEAREVLKSSEDYSVKSQIVGKLAKVSWKVKKNHAEATTYFKEAFQYALLSKSPQTIFFVNDYLSFLYDTGSFQEALTISKKFEKQIAISKSDQIGKKAYYKTLADVLIKIKDPKNAVATLEKVVLLNDSVSELENDIQVKEIEAKFQNSVLSQKNKVLATSHTRLNKNYLLLSSKFYLILGCTLLLLFGFIWFYLVLFKK